MESKGKLSFEAALSRTGFGLYNYLMVCIAGCIIISLVCVSYGNTILVPASACELQTTGAQRGLLAAIPTVALVFGAVIWGYYADVYGRKNTLLISLLTAAVINAIASISVNWVMLLCLQFVATFLASGQYSLAMTILSESVPIEKRNLVVLMVTSIFLMSQGLMAVLAIPIIPLTFSNYLPSLGIYWNSWRTLMIVYSVPSILSAVWLYFMHESPKFLFTKGREMEALTVLRKIHRLNVGSGATLQIDGIEPDEVKKTGPNSAKEQILPLFRAPLLKNTVLITLLFIFQLIGSFLAWLPTIANQFVQTLENEDASGLTLCDMIRSSINAPLNPDVAPCSLNSTALLIVLAIGVLQSVVNLLMSLVVNRVGRRNMTMIVTLVCGMFGILVNLVPNAIGSVVMFCAFLTGIVVMGLYTAMTVAAFPTYLRAFAMATTMNGSRISTFGFVQLLNYLLANNCELGFYLYSSIFASSAIIAFFVVNDRVSQTTIKLTSRM